MEVVKKGVLIQEKSLPKLNSNRCGICRDILMMQVYHYDGGLTKVIHCKKCNTYSHLKKPKTYTTKMQPIKKPKFLDDK